jgi:hypothetical protein
MSARKVSKKRGEMLQMFPLLALSLVVYAGLGLASGDPVTPWYEREAFSVLLTSGDIWRIGGGHLFISFSMLMLFFELLRSTRGGRASILNHAFSVMVFIVTLLLFLMVRGYGNSVFFIFMSMTLMDFLAGFIITAVSARHGHSLTHASD